MKVLQCFNVYLSNSENWVFRLLKNLDDVENVITAKKFLKNNFFDSKFKYLEFPVLPYEDFSVNRKDILKYLLSKILNQVRKLYFPYVRWIAKDIDIIHSHFANTAWHFHHLSKKLRVPHVISFYGYDYESLPYLFPEWDKYYKILFKEARLFICEGTHGAKILKEKGCRPEKIRVVKLGLELHKVPFFIRNKQSNELRLIQIASFGEKKGHIYTVKSFLNALQYCPNMTLTLVGGKSESIRLDIIHLVKQSGFEHKVTFLDSIDFHKLHEFMKDYQVFIHPSCYAANRDCEGGAPVVLLDAQATGMPIIATTHCDISDEVIHGVTGLLSPEKDVEMLTKSIQKFYAMDQEEYEFFARNGRAHIEENYEAKNNSAILRKAYEELMVN